MEKSCRAKSCSSVTCGAARITNHLSPGAVLRLVRASTFFLGDGVQDDGAVFADWHID